MGSRSTRRSTRATSGSPIDSIKEILNQPDDPASAVVSINPSNGAIRAMTAVVPGKKNIQFNLAAQGRRQSGSSFKTFVLTEAIRQGINPYTTNYLSAPFHWQPDPNSEPWDVSTYSHSYIGAVPIATGTLSSDNTVYARLTLDVGPENVVADRKADGHQDGAPAGRLDRARLERRLRARDGLGLRDAGRRRRVLASRWRSGRSCSPTAASDKDAGWGVSKRKRVFSDGVAYEVTKILHSNILGGTGVGANYGDPSAAGKTGTTDDSADAWFAGYTPRASTVVWVGYPNAQIAMSSVHGITVAGGTFPASIWRLFMSRALDGAPYLSWPYPRNPVVWVPFTGQYAFVGAPPKPEKPEKDKKKTRDEDRAALDGPADDD